MSDIILEQLYRRDRLQCALAKMPTLYHRLAIVLYLMGYHQYEIAEVYGCTKQNIQQIVTEFKKRNGVYYASL